MSARLGLGLAALGRPGYVTLNHASDLGGRYDPSTMEAHAHAVLDAAFDVGIRYVDAARSYGRAEDFLATWLRKREITPDEVVIASKWGYTYTAGWSTSATQHEVKDHSSAAFVESTATEDYRRGAVGGPAWGCGLLIGQGSYHDVPRPPSGEYKRSVKPAAAGLERCSHLRNSRA